MILNTNLSFLFSSRFLDFFGKTAWRFRNCEKGCLQRGTHNRQSLPLSVLVPLSDPRVKAKASERQGKARHLLYLLSEIHVASPAISSFTASVCPWGFLFCKSPQVSVWTDRSTFLDPSGQLTKSWRSGQKKDPKCFVGKKDPAKKRVLGISEFLGKRRLFEVVKTSAFKRIWKINRPCLEVQRVAQVDHEHPWSENWSRVHVLHIVWDIPENQDREGGSQCVGFSSL